MEQYPLSQLSKMNYQRPYPFNGESDRPTTRLELTLGMAWWLTAVAATPSRDGWEMGPKAYFPANLKLKVKNEVERKIDK